MIMVTVWSAITGSRAVYQSNNWSSTYTYTYGHVDIIFDAAKQFFTP